MQIIMLLLVFVMLAVIVWDITRYIIPNWLVGLLLLVYPVSLAISPAVVDWQMALLGFFLVFAVGYFIFSMGWMGGGDIKLVTVCALWVGFLDLPMFLVLFGFLGGVMCLLLVLLRSWMDHILVLVNRNFSLPRVLTKGAPVPYGVPIALAFLFMIAKGKIPLLAGL